MLLFVRGASPPGQAAIALLRHVMPRGEVAVIDVFREPEVAERYGVVATPTLIRLEPPPRARLVGNITEQRVLACLNQ
jgi:circadian clock protein KaiB